MLDEVRPWFSGWRSRASIDRFRRDMDELFDRFFGDFRYRDPMSPMTMSPAVESFFKDGNGLCASTYRASTQKTSMFQSLAIR